VLRRTGYEVAAIEQFNQPGAELPSTTVGRVAYVCHSVRFVCDPTDGDDAPTPREHTRETRARGDFHARRLSIARRRPRMRGDGVPQENVLLEIELGEYALDDGRGRFGRTAARELAFRGERDPGDARAAVPGSLADQQERRAGLPFEVRDETLASDLRFIALRVLVEGLPDPCCRELLDERGRRYHGPSVTGSSGNRAERAATAPPTRRT